MKGETVYFAQDCEQVIEHCDLFHKNMMAKMFCKMKKEKRLFSRHALPVEEGHRAKHDE